MKEPPRALKAGPPAFIVSEQGGAIGDVAWARTFTPEVNRAAVPGWRGHRRGTSGRARVDVEQVDYPPASAAWRQPAQPVVRQRSLPRRNQGTAAVEREPCEAPAYSRRPPRALPIGECP